jgi:sulfur-carrier protein adenylyltransferase/sulfurtransferase
MQLLSDSKLLQEPFMFDKLKNLFSSSESLGAEQAKKFMQNNDEGSYTLLDVRQPSEYEHSHIPGATLIPLPRLIDRINELDPEKPVIVYCTIGGRSRVAAQILRGRGFKAVYHLMGGMQGWTGPAVYSAAELATYTITEAESPSQVMRIAYGM